MSDNMHTPSNSRIPAPQENPSPDMQDNVHPYPGHSSVDSTTISAQTSDPRPLIRPRGFGFEGSKNCVPTITQSFKAHFVGPWPTFSNVPNEIKDLWFQTFSKSFRWKKDDSALIRKNWEKICRRRLSDHLSRDRQKFKDSCPPWIDLQHWKQLLSYWNSEKFKIISGAAKRNWSSVGPTHTGGSVSFTEHEDRAEDFNRLKEYYSHISSSSSSVGSSAIPNDKELFVEACGGFKKERDYGLGSESPIIKSQLDELKNKVAELKEELKEKDNKYKDICNYLKQIAKHAGSSSLPPVPSTLIKGDDDTIADNPP